MFRRWWGARLRNRLLLSSTVMVVVFLVLQGILSYAAGRISVQHEVEQGNRRLAVLVAKDVSAKYEDIRSNIALAGRQLETSSGSLASAAQLMSDVRLSAPLTYRTLYLLDGAGHPLILVSGSLETLEPAGSAEKYIVQSQLALSDDVKTAYEAAQRERLFISPVQVMGADRTPVMYASMPVAAGLQKNRTLVIEVDLRAIWRQIDEIFVGKTGQAFVVTRNGTIVAHPDRAYVGRTLPPELQPVLDGFEGQTRYTDPVSGQGMLAAYSPVGKLSGWGVVVEQSYAEALAPVGAIAVITVGVLLTAIILATAVTMIIASSVTGPLQRLAEVTQDIADTGDLDRSIRAEGQDEIGQLADSFNRMMERLRQSDRALKAHSVQLEDRVAERTQALETAREQLVRREKLVSLGQIAGSISHELRNPLGNISNAAYYLNMVLDGTDQTVRENLDVISHEVRKADNIISNLLDFSRTRPPVTTKVSIPDLLNRTLAQHPPPDGVELSCDADPALPDILCDPEQMDLVLGNLVVNAYQAMPNGGKLSLGIRREGSQLVVSITDTGRGIPPENMPRLFEPLFTTKPRGIGLGLALSKNLVEQHNGSIDVESRLGEGTCFTVRLPLESDNVPAAGNEVRD